MNFLVVGVTGTVFAKGFTDHETTQMIEYISDMVKGKYPPKCIYIFKFEYNGEYEKIIEWFRNDEKKET